MAQQAELEIGIFRREAETYTIEMRFNQPDSEADIRLAGGQARFDLDELGKLAYSDADYRQALTGCLFADAEVKSSFTQSLTVAQDRNEALRLRLLIDASAAELHSLRWETLLNPQDNTPLCTNPNILFSRYLISQDWRPVRMRRKDQLKALIFVSNPNNLSDYNLGPIDVVAETERARASLGVISTSAIPEGETGQRATLDSLFTSLRGDPIQENGYDILYVVCHGVLDHNEPCLWLEDEGGSAKRLYGTELVTRIKELEYRPRLIVLASCESAGNQTGQALSALGPRLAQAGIPAVVAMQGKISLDTIALFMPEFFKALLKDRSVDQAMAIARGAVRDRPDYWIPALFMRLRRGHIWYTPGFGGDKPELENWEGLIRFIQQGICTAIVGPGLLESILGDRRQIAMHWAEEHGYPLSRHDLQEMPRVAQYLATRQRSLDYVQEAYREALQGEIIRRYEQQLPEKLRAAKFWKSADLISAIDRVGMTVWNKENPGVFQQLAKLRLPIYITANPYDLIANALIEEGVEPQVRFCPWNYQWNEQLYKTIPKEKWFYKGVPSPEQPLVYHLFGHLSEPSSLVFTQDEYFDYLIGVTANKEKIPSVVRAALASTTLLFLGFQVEDWSFRAFFRVIMAQGGREQLKYKPHAAAQIEPDEGEILDATRARRYLEQYFDSGNISLYWGSSEDFLKALWKNMAA